VHAEPTSANRRLVTHLEHVGFYVPDIEQARNFYVDLLGFVEVEQTEKRLYLRCIEEGYHHSLTLILAPEIGLDHLGYRLISREAGSDVANLLKTWGCGVEILTDPEPGVEYAIRTHDPTGFPAQYFWSEDTGRSMLLQSHLWRGIPPTRIDHVNVRTPDPAKTVSFLTDGLGARTREIALADDGEYMGVWVAWKPTLHDVAVFPSQDRYVHHVGIYVSNADAIIRIGDILADAGFRSSLERGPGRHGIGNALFFYVKDPWGNRIEFYTGDRMVFNDDQAPIVWSSEDARERGLIMWGPPPPDDWVQPIPFRRSWTEEP
jgi:catechol 2,3-dioxygenase